jgi:hypothetical protein
VRAVFAVVFGTSGSGCPVGRTRGQAVNAGGIVYKWPGMIGEL